MVDDRYRRRDEHDHERGSYRDDFYPDRARYGAAGHPNESTRDRDHDPRDRGFDRDDDRAYRRGGIGRQAIGGHGPEEYADRPHSGYGRGGYNRSDYDETVRAGGDLYGRDRYPGNTTREGYARPGRGNPGGYGERFAGGTDDYGRDYGRDLEAQAYGTDPRSAYGGARSSSYGDFRPRADSGEHRGRGPRGYKRSDERIREDVNDRLSDDGMVDASDIEVSVSNGEVTLSGTVSSRDQKRRAEDIAEAVSAVSHVQNNLRVGQSGSGNHMSGASAPASGGSAGTSAGSDQSHAQQTSRKT